MKRAFLSTSGLELTDANCAQLLKDGTVVVVSKGEDYRVDQVTEAIVQAVLNPHNKNNTTTTSASGASDTSSGDGQSGPSSAADGSDAAPSSSSSAFSNNAALVAACCGDMADANSAKIASTLAQLSLLGVGSQDRALLHVVAKHSVVAIEALQQLKQAASLPTVRLAVGLPDLHPGKGCPIGAAIVSERVFPHLIGEDIGCGMSVVLTDLKADVSERQVERWAQRLYLDDPWTVLPQEGQEGEGEEEGKADGDINQVNDDDDNDDDGDNDGATSSSSEKVDKTSPVQRWLTSPLTWGSVHLASTCSSTKDDNGNTTNSSNSNTSKDISDKGRARIARNPLLERVPKNDARVPAVNPGPLAKIGLTLSSFDRSVGTIGRGNHFAELQAVESVEDREVFDALGLVDDRLYLTVHSGSRGLGEAVLGRFSTRIHAIEGLRPDSEEGRAYLDAHNECISWARRNRALIGKCGYNCCLSGLVFVSHALLYVVGGIFIGHDKHTVVHVFVLFFTPIPFLFFSSCSGSFLVVFGSY